MLDGGDIRVFFFWGKLVVGRLILRHLADPGGQPGLGWILVHVIAPGLRWR